MKLRRFPFFPFGRHWIVVLLAGYAPIAAAGQSVGLELGLETIATGLQLPVGIANAADGSGRLFIVEQTGRILVHDGDRLLETPFLDLQDRISCCGERGLLGLAFHPDFESNRLFYVHYSDRDGDTVLARYEAFPGQADRADPTSARILLRVSQPFSNHNGGQLAFGPDGLLYLGLGDGGSGGDPQNNAQDLGTLLGKLLRLDVDQPDPGLDYGIPDDNPFVGGAGVRGEIWAWGLRNPWRFSFDRVTGDLFIADVGQESWEEVSFQRAESSGGENYGWRRMEGTHCFDPAVGCQDPSLTLPILEYSHALGCSVIGGFRYRGSKQAVLQGVYLFADFCSGTVWAARQGCGGSWSFSAALQTGFAVSSFGEDEAGELYVAQYSSSDGKLHRLVVTQAPSASQETGLCLNDDDRFEVTADFLTAEGQSGPGRAVKLTHDSGYFWFFNPDNIEVVVKVLDACVDPFNRFWVFAGGLTDVEVTLRVVDTLTGQERMYVNPLGMAFQPIRDTDAFATCP